MTTKGLEMSKAMLGGLAAGTLVSLAVLTMSADNNADQCAREVQRASYQNSYDVRLTAAGFPRINEATGVRAMSDVENQYRGTCYSAESATQLTNGLLAGMIVAFAVWLGCAIIGKTLGV